MFTNRCKECNAKLSSRNGNRKKAVFSQLCGKCYKHPSHEDRCIYTKRDGSRCKLRKNYSCDKYCGIHKRIAERERNG